jgi:hypothetical protein
MRCTPSEVHAYEIYAHKGVYFTKHACIFCLIKMVIITSLPLLLRGNPSTLTFLSPR